MDQLPGPPPAPILGNIHQVNPGYKVHIRFTEWADQYGSMYRMKLMNRNSIVVTGLAEIKEVLITKGKDFGGRSGRFRISYMTDNRSDMMSLDYGPDNVYRRKLLHSHLKQYGEGINRIEDATRTIVDEMIENLIQRNGEALDVEESLQHAIIDLTYVLLLGEIQQDQEDREAIMTVVQHMVDVLSVSGPGLWLDIFPWLRFFGHSSYKKLVEMRSIVRKFTNKWRAKAEGMECNENIIHKLLNIVNGENPYNLNDRNVEQLTWQLFIGATSTTVATLATMMNALAQNPNIQEKLYHEIMEKVGPNAHISFKDREKLPYCYATVLEATR